MLEESLPTIWATMNSWFTPTVLFVLLNLMIGTIFVASGFGNKPQQQNEDQQKRPQLARVPSRLERLKSMNFYRFRSEDLNPFPSTTTTIVNPPPEPETHQIQEQVSTQEPKEVPEKTQDEVYNHHVTRTTSDTYPASGSIPVKLPKKMKKSASAKSAFSHFEEEDIVEPRVPRPSTVREGKKKSGDLQSFGDDEEVDAKADDFINKFKQQLKLQRLDSILRYKETLTRG
ncbi:Protein of unknown function DUF761 [Macleaya cordata]|uniref:DUF4408 domain-containing protein n=1 Tax=Macleaya cordata TaxID=56857 RepID=A0A200Q0M9_MACCD|nr:Protein of unknown function DUF761 [Macleaya cordata]